MSLHFTGEHEWIRLEGDVATVGISTHAQEALGDIVFAEVPDTGRTLNKGDEAAVVESVKAASDVYAPVAGEVIEGNPALADNPGLINQDPEGEGWFFKLRVADPAELNGLMDEGAYREWVKTLWSCFQPRPANGMLPIMRGLAGSCPRSARRPWSCSTRSPANISSTLAAATGRCRSRSSSAAPMSSESTPARR